MTSPTTHDPIAALIPVLESALGQKGRVSAVADGAQWRVDGLKLDNLTLVDKLKAAGASLPLQVLMPPATGLDSVLGGRIGAVSFTLRVTGPEGAREAQMLLTAAGGDKADDLPPSHYYQLFDAVLGKRATPAMVVGYVAHHMHRSSGKVGRQLAAEAAALVSDWFSA